MKNSKCFSVAEPSGNNIFHLNVYHTRYLIELLFVVVSIEKWPDRRAQMLPSFSQRCNKTNWKGIETNIVEEESFHRALLSPMQVGWIPTRLGWTEQLWKHPNEILRSERKKHLFFISAFHRFSMCLLNLYESGKFWTVEWSTFGSRGIGWYTYSLKPKKQQWKQCRQQMTAGPSRQQKI